MHQIKAPHLSGADIRQLYGRGIVDDNVDAAKMLSSRLDRRSDRSFFPDIHDKRQRLTATFFNVSGRSMNGSLQFPVGPVRLCRNNHIGTFRSCPPCDGKSNATRSAGDKKCLVFQGHLYCSRTSCRHHDQRHIRQHQARLANFSAAFHCYCQLVSPIIRK